MIVYNVTTQVDRRIVDDWLHCQQSEHIPQIIGTGLFDNYRIYRLLEPDNQPGPTFTIQYFSSSEEGCRKYITEFAPLMSQKAFVRWGNKFIAHRTVMELVH